MNPSLVRYPRASSLRREGMTTVEFVIVLCLIGALSVGLWRTFGHHLEKRLGQSDTEIYDNLRTSSKTSSVDRNE